MKTIETQMKIADKIMRRLETFDPTCILAGGAPRDWHFGNLATDLDFFVHWRPDFANQKWRYIKILESLGFNPRVKGSSEFKENYKRNPHLMAVYEFAYMGEKIQVMFMDEKTFHCVVDLFPLGICQAWYKRPVEHVSEYYSSGGIKTSKEFDLCEGHKILRLVNDLYDDGDGYLEKIRAKFPDYEYLGENKNGKT